MRLHNRSKSLLRDAHIAVRSCRGHHPVCCDFDASVNTILETQGVWKGRRQLSMNLWFYGTNEGDVDKALRTDRVQHPRGNWHAKASGIGKELTKYAQAVIDVVSPIGIRIINKSLPPGCSAFAVSPLDSGLVSSRMSPVFQLPSFEQAYSAEANNLDLMIHQDLSALRDVDAERDAELFFTLDPAFHAILESHDIVEMW